MVPPKEEDQEVYKTINLYLQLPNESAMELVRSYEAKFYDISRPTDGSKDLEETIRAPTEGVLPEDQQASASLLQVPTED